MDRRIASGRSYCVSIGGVRIDVTSPVEFTESPGELYSSFLTPSGESGGALSTIDVEVRAALAPPNAATTLFDTESAWTMQPEGAGYRLNMSGGPPGSASVVVCSDSETRKVVAYTGGLVEACGEVRDGCAAVPRVPVGYPLDQLLLMNHLGPRGGVIAHAAGAVVGGKALVLAGVSGAGKSTIARLFAAAGLGDSLLSDDRLVLRVADGGASPQIACDGGEATVWGTPWAGDARVARNESAPLGALMFLVKDEKDELVPIEPRAALQSLLKVVSVPWYDALRFPAILDTCAWLVEAHPCYELHFKPDADVVSLLVGRSWS